MAKKSKPPTPLETLSHKDATRSNNPTAEHRGLAQKQEAAPEKEPFPRKTNPKDNPEFYPGNHDLDPQLMWKDKDKEDKKPLEVDCVPIYIQEHIHPKVLIEDLRRQSQKSEFEKGERTDDWFDEWDRELTPEDKIEFYQHSRPWTNRMILGNSLEVMTSLTKKEGLEGQVQCIYVDPPYGIKFASNWQPTTESASRDARSVGSNELSREPDVIKAFRDTWKYGINSYLSYLRDRLTVAHDLLNDSGSIFVQISDANMHLVRGVLDEIFDSSNYISTIRFRKKTKSLGGKFIEEMADYILWYGKNKEATKYRQLHVERDYSDDFSSWKYYETREGKRFEMTKEDIITRKPLPNGSKRYRLVTLWPAALDRNYVYPLHFRGKDWHPSEGLCYPSTLEKMQRLINANYVEPTGNYLHVLIYDDGAKYQKITANWNDTIGARNKGYVVETSPKVIERCILMTTDPGDLVLDPTCGGGTTAYVSEMYGRRWITIDTSRVAITLARSRLMGALFNSYKLKDAPSSKGHFEDEVNPKKGFQYEFFPNITLSSIVNNTQIDVIVGEYEKPIADVLTAVRKDFGEEINEWDLQDLSEQHPKNEILNQYWALNTKKKEALEKCIAEGSEKKYLYDRPLENRRIKRVTGKFTVESLSPHRVVPPDVEDEALLEALREQASHDGTEPPKPASKRLRPKSVKNGETKFVNVVWEYLKQADIKTTKKDERLSFESVDPCLRGSYVQFEARFREQGKQKRAAICIGPQYGTVTPDLIRLASKEAADFFDILIVLGYAFEAHANENLINTGSLQVLRVRMHQDLQSANSYEPDKKSTAFVIFGEPDIVFTKNPDGNATSRNQRRRYLQPRHR